MAVLAWAGEQSRELFRAETAGTTSHTSSESRQPASASHTHTANGATCALCVAHMLCSVDPRARHYLMSTRTPVELSHMHALSALHALLHGRSASGTALPLCVSPPPVLLMQATRHIARPRRHPNPHLMPMSRTRTNTCTLGRVCSDTHEQRQLGQCSRRRRS